MTENLANNTVGASLEDMNAAYERMAEINMTGDFWTHLGYTMKDGDSPRLDEHNSHGWMNWRVTEKAARKIRILISPHWKTLMKMEKINDASDT